MQASAALSPPTAPPLAGYQPAHHLPHLVDLRPKPLLQTGKGRRALHHLHLQHAT
jgi:hypothetical protein